MSGVPVEKVAETMGRLMEEGLIHGWGLSQVDVDVIDRADLPRLDAPLHKYPNVVPIPGSKNKERIIENLDAANVELTDGDCPLT